MERPAQHSVVRWSVVLCHVVQYYVIQRDSR